ncbi:hypothetical protein C5S31_08020 [ANME-1 cluster archaeon GoMg2]|nr:hypothetical protein [ANME-1 cluster archaeon GoMg2]
MRGRCGLLVICAAIMLAAVIAAMMPIVSADSRGDNFNHIAAQDGLQKVLIGQNLEFEGFNAPVAVYRVVSGDIANTYTVDNNSVYNVNWPTAGAFYVNYNTTTEKADAQLSVEAPIIPLEIKVGSATVSGVMVSTTAIRIDTAGINLFDEDVVDLVINGPAGQISYDAKNDQQFKGITVSDLKGYGATGGLKISGWKVGEYTFQVKTVSGQACGLEDESAVKSLNIGVIPTPTPVTTPDEKVDVTPLRTTPVVTPTPVPTSAPTPVPTVMPSPSVAPVPVSTPIPTPTPTTPCFEFMCAVVGLVVAVCLIRRRG